MCDTLQSAPRTNAFRLLMVLASASAIHQPHHMCVIEIQIYDVCAYVVVNIESVLPFFETRAKIYIFISHWRLPPVQSFPADRKHRALTHVSSFDLMKTHSIRFHSTGISRTHHIYMTGSVQDLYHTQSICLWSLLLLCSVSSIDRSLAAFIYIRIAFVGYIITDFLSIPSNIFIKYIINKLRVHTIFHHTNNIQT